MEMIRNEIQRDIKCDIIRLIAIFMVIMSHVVEYTDKCHHFLYAINNSLFFMVSGYLFFFSYKMKLKRNFIYFFRSKILKILFPYLFWSFGAICAHILVDRNFSIDNIIYWFKETVLYANSIWFFAALICINCFAFFMLESKRKSIFLSIILVLLVYSIPLDVFAYQQAKWMFPIFMLGYLQAKYNSAIEKKREVCRFFAFLWIPLALYGGKKAYLYEHFEFSLSNVVWWLYYIVVAILGFWFCFYFLCPLFSKKEFLISISKKIGDNTIAIYPISIIFTQYFSIILKRFGIDIAQIYNTNVDKYIIYLIFVILDSIFIMFSSYLIDKLMKKISVYRFLSRGKWYDK